VSCSVKETFLRGREWVAASTAPSSAAAATIAPLMIKMVWVDYRYRSDRGVMRRYMMISSARCEVVINEELMEVDG